MTRVRRPVIGGVTRGSGTSTLAAALHAVDGGFLAPGAPAAADVLVCRPDVPSLRQAAVLARAASGPRPVLALGGTAQGAPVPPVPAGHFAAVVALPEVRRWSTGDARGEAAVVLAYAPERLPQDVRAYAGALHRIVSALVASGQLQRPAAPRISRPPAASLWRGLRPVSPASTRPAPARDRPAEPDDEAIEGEPVAAGARCRAVSRPAPGPPTRSG